jgi:hypothetical protein
MTVSGTRFIGNVAEGSGGGAFSGGVTAIAGTQFVSNTSGLYGGGAYAQNAMTATDVHLGNVARYSGGAYAEGAVILTEVSFRKPFDEVMAVD